MSTFLAFFCGNSSSAAMSYQHPHDLYHDNPSARSPGSQRHQQPLHRQHSRQFDAYGPMPVNLYDDPTARYDTGRLDRLNPSMHNNSYAYDLPGSQTWNPNGFANPQALGGIRSASASMKTATRGGGRAALPTVRVVFGQNISTRLTGLVKDVAGPAARHPKPFFQPRTQSASGEPASPGSCGSPGRG